MVPGVAAEVDIVEVDDKGRFLLVRQQRAYSSKSSQSIPCRYLHRTIRLFLAGLRIPQVDLACQLFAPAGREITILSGETGQEGRPDHSSPGAIAGGAVDRRNRAPHGADIRTQLTAMVDGVEEHVPQQLSKRCLPGESIVDQKSDPVLPHRLIQPCDAFP